MHARPVASSSTKKQRPPQVEEGLGHVSLPTERSPDVDGLVEHRTARREIAAVAGEGGRRPRAPVLGPRRAPSGPPAPRRAVHDLRPGASGRARTSPACRPCAGRRRGSVAAEAIQWRRGGCRGRARARPPARPRVRSSPRMRSATRVSKNVAWRSRIAASSPDCASWSQRIAADRLEHREALAVPSDEALVDERAERVELGVADGLRGLEREAAAEDRQRGEQSALLGIEQVVRPGQRPLQGAMPLRCVAVAALEQLQRRVQPGEDRVWREQPDARGRELERERQPVEPSADGCDRARVGVGHLERRLDGPGAFDEEGDGVGSGDVSCVTRRPWVRQAERRGSG